jgi:hypothetical protein
MMMEVRASVRMILLLSVFAWSPGCGSDHQRPLGVCEGLARLVSVSTADGSSSIRDIEVVAGFCRYQRTCFVPAGATAGCAMTYLLVTGAGRCAVTVVATDGRRVDLTLEARLQPSNRRCRTDQGRIIDNVPDLTVEPIELVVDFGPRDGSAGS